MASVEQTDFIIEKIRPLDDKIKNVIALSILFHKMMDYAYQSDLLKNTALNDDVTSSLTKLLELEPVGMNKTPENKLLFKFLKNLKKLLGNSATEELMIKGLHNLVNPQHKTFFSQKEYEDLKEICVQFVTQWTSYFEKKQDNRCVPERCHR